ncbi:MAG: HD-GYP domain-containing protein [Lachnospiraceae bacterium]|nr:HD-GYP domain-containing protein [Lachnospiraceae bacterium]
MFNTISVLSLRGTGGGSYFSSKIAGMILDDIGVLFLYLAAWLYYRLVVCSLAKTAQERESVNWKIFVVPPALFTLFYTMLAALMIKKQDTLGEKLILSVYLFSTVIVFLFIWAFQVIIKNINATIEAVKAQEEAEKAKDEVKELSVEVMEALAHTIDAKDEYTKGHSVRVAKYSMMIAEKLGMGEEDCENVYYMGLLHDLGKIGVPNEIINSPTNLTDEQYDVIKTHPALGYDILSEIKSRPDLVTGARWHHERYDGKGYPDGKSGEDIPILARIIAVADSYDAMTSNRSYRKYMPQEKVREEIVKGSGTQFDPKIAECMLRIIGEDVDYELHE